MFKIKIKRENGEVSVSLTLQTSNPIRCLQSNGVKIKQKFSDIVLVVVSAFLTLGQYLRFKFKLFRIVFKILGANPKKISLKEEGGETLLVLSEQIRSAHCSSYWQNLAKNIGKIFKRPERKIIKGTAIVSIIALILQLSIFLIPSTKANENGLCSFAADTVLAIDTTGSMDGGDVQSKCEWENLECVESQYSDYLCPDTSYYGTYMCVYHEENGLNQEECQANNDGTHCDDPVYTPPVPKKIDAVKEAAKFFTDKLGTNDQSALVSFNNTAVPEKTLSNDHSEASGTKKFINDLTPQPGTGTNIGAAIDEANKELSSFERANPQAAKVVILLTDGKDSNTTYVTEKAQEAANLGYKIFTIGLGSGVNPAMLESIAATTGAKKSDGSVGYYPATDGNALEGIYNQIAGDICQYGSISGCKYQDANNNRLIDEGEEKLADWEILLSGDFSASQLTDENVCYRFAGLLAGNYTVSEGENLDKQPFLQTYPIENNYNITLADGENLTEINFANYLPACGNSILDEDFEEQCDDGNLEDGDGCSAICQIEEGENPPAEPVCGNGILEEEEGCDDGNIEDGDGCSSTCTIEEQPEEPPQPVCGNGILEEGEDCDGETPQACTTEQGYSGYRACTNCLWDNCISEAFCGDGIKNGLEQCDDENTQNGDGCSSACQTEQQPGGGGGEEGIQAGDVVVTEIMHNPQRFPAFNRWFEIYNNTDNQIDLQGCILSDLDLVYPNYHVIETSLVIPARSYKVLGGSNDYSRNGGVNVDYVYSNFLLENESDEIILSCNDKEIDRVEYNDTFPNSRGASIILADPNLNNNAGSNWCISTSSFGAGDLGTPGAENDPCGGATCESSELSRQCVSNGLARITYTWNSQSCGDNYSVQKEDYSCTCLETEVPGDCIDDTHRQYTFSYNFNYCQQKQPESREDPTCSNSGVASQENVSSGGGGGNSIIRSVLNVKTTGTTRDGITITWETTFPGTSQVIYSTQGESHSFDSSNPPLYGYAHATPEYDTDPKVTFHTVTITGLTPGTIYFYRTVSRGSPEVWSDELSFATIREVSLEAIEEQLKEIGGQIELIREELEKILPEVPEVLAAEELTAEEGGAEGGVIEEVVKESPEESLEEEVVGLEKEEEAFRDKGLLAAMGAIPFSSKLILIIAGITIIGLFISWFNRKRKR